MFAAIPIPECRDECCCRQCGCQPCNCNSCTPVPTCACPNPVALLDTVADLAAFVPYIGLRLIAVQGKDSAGDGLGGYYTYHENSTADADGYWVVSIPEGGRYFKDV